MNFNDWLRQLRESGWIGPVRLGMSRDELVGLFGAANDTAKCSRKAQRPEILKYDNVEFHFGPKWEDGLNLIYSDTEDGIPTLSISECSGRR
ncbi:hypothetical protein NG895_10970 [Aeoliella sp. ICT_H6.2]|uniref:Uncharacterized protein n=1 Tax=Aeoliella straminimaris TaxID=2954799 RepID=A0A9X2JGI6_9BACT|nr:hypothetical protein [Aeoliella straminimaris]MCO6044427.1 hypothetical protein [Aeoliella straminimaris]